MRSRTKHVSIVRGFPSERIQESWRLAKPRCLFTVRRRVITAQYAVFRLIKGMKTNDLLYKLRIEESSKEFFRVSIAIERFLSLFCSIINRFSLLQVYDYYLRLPRNVIVIITCRI